MRQKISDLLVQPESVKYPLVLNKDMTLEDAHHLIAETQQEYIPVADEGGKLCAIFEKNVLVEALLEKQKYEVEQLKAYISGGPLPGLAAQLYI